MPFSPHRAFPQNNVKRFTKEEILLQELTTSFKELESIKKGLIALADAKKLAFSEQDIELTTLKLAFYFGNIKKIAIYLKRIEAMKEDAREFLNLPLLPLAHMDKNTMKGVQAILKKSLSHR